MKIRKISFDGWGRLSGELALDPERVAVLLVDTESERAELAAALRAIIGARGELVRAGGAVEALVEGPGGETSAVRRVAGERAAPGDGHAPAWLVEPGELARGVTLDDLVRWLRRRADAPAGTATAEDVRRRLAAWGTREGRADAELARVRESLAGVDAERARAAERVARLERIATARAALEPVVAALEDPSVRCRLSELERRLWRHRAAHRRFKQLCAELREIEAARTPDVLAAQEAAQLLGRWERRQEALGAHDEALDDARLALHRCERALARRPWAACLEARAAEDVGRLAGRIEGVAKRIEEQRATIARERERTGEEGGAVRRLAELADRVGDVSREERELVVGSLAATLEGVKRTRTMAGDLAERRGRLDRVYGVQSQLRVLVAMMCLGGGTFALSVHASGWARVNGIDAAALIAAGGMAAAVGVGIWLTAGGYVAHKRGILESQVHALRVPLELEELRLSVLEFKVGEVCRKHDYPRADALAADLEELDRLVEQSGTRAYRAARAELARLRAAELAPLAVEAADVIAAHDLPEVAADAATSLRGAWAQLQTHSIGLAFAGRLRRGVAALAAARERLAREQEQLLPQVRARLSESGVSADVARDVPAAHARLEQLHRAAVRREEIVVREIPAALERMLAIPELVSLRRERAELRARVTWAPGVEALEDVLPDRARTQDPRALAAADPAGGALLDELIAARRPLTAQVENERRARDEARATLTAALTRGPRLRVREAALETHRARVRDRADAAAAALGDLEVAAVLGRGPLARALNAAAIPRWTAARPHLRGTRFDEDLALRLPEGVEPDPELDAALAQLAVRAALALQPVSGGQAGLPLVLLEPFDGFEPRALARLAAFLAGCVRPTPQVLVVSRRRSRWEHVRWEAPAVFPRMQLVAV